MRSRRPQSDKITSPKRVSRREEAGLTKSDESSMPMEAGGGPDSSTSKSFLTSAATPADVRDSVVQESCEDEAREKQEVERSLNRTFYLPRLRPEAYLGFAVVHWTLTMEQRATGWLSDAFHAAFREMMLHTQAREHLVCPIYCLMPDHIHLVWMGVREDSDQRVGMSFLRTHLKPLITPVEFQHQPHDHVLDKDERRQNVFANACAYVAENPVRAELVQCAHHWKFTGAIVPGYPSLHPTTQSNFWEVFWGVYWKSRGGRSGSTSRR